MTFLLSFLLFCLWCAALFLTFRMIGVWIRVRNQMTTWEVRLLVLSWALLLFVYVPWIRHVA